jgi:transposase
VRSTSACIPSCKKRKVAIPHDATLYRQRYIVENMCGGLKNLRCIHTRSDRCALAFASAIALAAIVIFWINEA